MVPVGGILETVLCAPHFTGVIGIDFHLLNS
jgi:hypothetical protein